MQGAGFVCVYVLDSLATQALKVTKASLESPEIAVEEDVMAEVFSDENEVILEKVEEEQMAQLSDDSEAEEMTNALNNAMLDLKLNSRTPKDGKTPGNILHLGSLDQDTTRSLVDSESWRLVVTMNCDYKISFTQQFLLQYGTGTSAAATESGR